MHLMAIIIHKKKQNVRYWHLDQRQSEQSENVIGTNQCLPQHHKRLPQPLKSSFVIYMEGKLLVNF